MATYLTRQDWFNLHKVAPVGIRAVVSYDGVDGLHRNVVEVHINKGDTGKLIEFGYNKFPFSIKVIYVEH